MSQCRRLGLSRRAFALTGFLTCPRPMDCVLVERQAPLCCPKSAPGCWFGRSLRPALSQHSLNGTTYDRSSTHAISSERLPLDILIQPSLWKRTERTTRKEEGSAAASPPTPQEARNADGAWQTRCAEGNICCCWPTELPPATAASAMTTAGAATEEPVCQCL